MAAFVPLPNPSKAPERRVAIEVGKEQSSSSEPSSPPTLVQLSDGDSITGPRRHPSMLTGNTSYPSAGRRIGRFLRRQRQRLRQITQSNHPALRGIEKQPHATTPSSGQSFLPRRGQKIQCDLECIVDKFKPSKAARHGKTYPEFDSLEAYQVDEATTASLRRAEAERLLDVIKDPDAPVVLENLDFLQNLKGDAAGYRRLSAMSQSIVTALALCLLDNECINVRFCTRLANHQRLQKSVQQAEVAAKSALSGRADSGSADSEDKENEDDELEAIFALLDYISAILARLISQTASGPYWLENVVSTLAARIAKMKFLLVDLASSATVAFDAGKEALEQIPDSGGGGLFSNVDDEDEECEEALRLIDANKKDGLTSEDEADVAAFCVSQNQYRSGINSALKYILFSLRLGNLAGLPVTTYEMCLVAYEIGFEGFKTVLFQDKDLEYSASSDRDVLNTAQSALIMLDQVLRKLADRPRSPDTPAAKPCKTECRTIVEWAYQGHQGHQGHQGYRGLDTASDVVDHAKLSESVRQVQLCSMADIITAMIPLITTSPILLYNFANYRTMMALTGGVGDVVSPFQEGQFGAFCRLYTSEFDDEATSRGVMRLSDALANRTFSRCRLLTHGKGSRGASVWNASSDDDHHPSKPNKGGGGRGPYSQVLEQLGEYCSEMDDWVIDETCVTISCRFYVSTIMMTALALAAGGLGMGFTVGERIVGVDPFNLATYTWVLAAFIVLICKSVLVEHWTWSDFLRWRVRCRSVSELAATTGVNEQLVIAKLLHEDCGGGILLTRGPFNSVFRRQTGSSDAFSIDRPISADTLMLSGLAILKVVTPRGNALVCLDYRRGTPLTVVQHQGVEAREMLICEDVDRLTKDHSTKERVRSRHRKVWRGAEPVRLHLAKTKDFKWKRVQGLYDFQDADVVFM